MHTPSSTPVQEADQSVGGLITKRDFLNFCDCPKKFALGRSREIPKAPLSAGSEMRMANGVFFGTIARELQEGFLVEYDPNAVTASKLTDEALKAGHETIYEATFVSDGLVTRVDILRQGPDGWHLIEVKSSSKTKPEHVREVAFQAHVLRSAGFEVQRFFVAHVNKESIRGQNPLSPQEAVVVEDVSDDVLAELPSVRASLAAMLALGQTIPTISLASVCTKCDYLPFCATLHSPQDIYYLPGIRQKEMVNYRSQGINEIGQMEASSNVVRSIQSGIPSVDSKLKGILESIVYPIHFVDFEAFMPMLPRYPGCHAYETIPFQWSNHILETLSSSIRHEEYLHNEDTDPRPRFAETLLQSLDGAGTILYYAPYEQTQANSLAALEFGGGQELVHAFKTKGLDLCKVIKQNYYHPAFGKSYSIKRTLPVLVPELSYETLPINNGELAMIEYERMLATVEPERTGIRQNLLEYCKLDTMAMVMLYRALMNECS